MAPTSQQAKTAKTKLLAGGKAPKARVQRYLKSVEPRLVEGAKSILLLKGIRCSDALSQLLRDLRAVLAPHAKLLGKNNQIVPFDDVGQQSLEFLCTKNDCSLFCVASHNKKRPNNLMLGRTFDRHVLDMVEIGILRYKSSLGDYGGVPKKRIGSKPMMLFVGDRWLLDVEYKRLQNLLIDFYRGDPVQKLVLSGLDHIMVFTVADVIASMGGDHDKPMIHQRTYFVKLKKNPSGGNVPFPFLSSSGPDMDFKIRRTQFAAPDLWRAALKQPARHKPKSKTKNQSTNLFGETVGRLHLERQDIDKMQGKKAKSLRIAGKLEAEEEKAAVENELEQEKETMGMEFRQTYGFDQDEVERSSRRGKK